MSTVGELLAEGFPLFAVDPRHGTGEAFVGEVRRRRGILTSVTLVYLDRRGARGFGVATLRAGDIDAVLVGFASRFDARFVTRRIKRRKRAFPPEAFDVKHLEVAVAGGARPIEVSVHKDLPLQFLAVSMEHDGGPADVWVLGWHTEVGDLAPLLLRVDAPIAASFDAQER